jgi:tripartite ATP-independent transporter DctM subunit
MTLTANVIFTFFLMFMFLFIGVPVGFSLGLAGLIGIWIGWGFDVAFGYIELVPYREVAHFTLGAIPLFILMGRFSYHGGIAESLYNLAFKWVGRLRGGLAMATMVSMAGFGAVCGSSVASTAAFSPLVVPEMDRYQYDKQLSLGSIAAAGTFALMIPPSISFIVYGVITGTSVGKCFIAGIIPGILSAGIYMVQIWIRCRLNPGLAPLAPSSITWNERFGAFKNIGPALVLVVIVLGGIYFGFMTPTEAGAVGAIGAGGLAFLRKGFGFFELKDSVTEAVGTAAMVFMVIIGAFLFGYFLSIGTVPQLIIHSISEAGMSRWVVLALILLMLIILGIFMDQMAISVLTLPLIFPVIVKLGFDPVWYAIIHTKTVELGMISPPFGLNVYVIQGVTGEPLAKVFRGIFPFMACDLLTLLILICLPQLSLFLPSQMG